MEHSRKMEIFQETIRRLKLNTNYSQGICGHLANSCLPHEHEEISSYFHSKKPKDILSERDWWSMDKEGFKKRIQFLENLINERD